jgi:hypothetical protein
MCNTGSGSGGSGGSGGRMESPEGNYYIPKESMGKASQIHKEQMKIDSPHKYYFSYNALQSHFNTGGMKHVTGSKFDPRVGGRLKEDAIKQVMGKDYKKVPAHVRL